MTDQLQVELVQHVGSDEMIANAARVSTDRDNEDRPIEGLIRYLAKNKHLSPFEHNSTTFMVTAPLFVRDQWVRHRTQSYNSLSLRYTNGALTESFYIPNEERPLVNEGKKSHPLLVTPPEPLLYAEMLDSYLDALHIASVAYETMVENGVAEEVARMVLPEATMTRFYATGNLRNWFAFVKERTAENAQWEIKQLAYQIRGMLYELYPISWNALLENN